MLNSDLKHPSAVQKATTPASDWLLFALLGLLLALGTLIRYLGIETRSFWLDEVTSLDIASRSLRAIVLGEGFDSHTPPFYYILLHFAFKLLPETVLGVRYLALVLDLFNIVVIYIVARNHSSKKLGLLTAALYSLSAFPIYYAQEGRMYSLLILLVLCTYGLAQNVATEKYANLRSLCLLLVGTAGMYTHYYYAFFLFSITLGLLLQYRTNLSKLLHWFVSCLLIAVLFLPWIRVVLTLMGSGGQSFREFTALVLPYTFFRFSAGYGIMPLNQSMKSQILESLVASMPALACFSIVFGTAVLLGLVSTWRSSKEKAFLLFFALFGPAALAFLISLKLPMLSERYLLVSYPFFLYLVVLGVYTIPARRRMLLGVPVLLCTLVATYQHTWNPEFQNTPWQAVFHELNQDKRGTSIYINPHYTIQVAAQYKTGPRLLKEFRGVTEFSESSGDLFWLIERGGAEFASEEALGGQEVELLEQRYVPYGNGLRVSLLRKKSESSFSPEEKQVPGQQ